MIRTAKILAYVFLVSIVVGWLGMSSWLANHPEISGGARGGSVESLAGAEAVAP